MYFPETIRKLFSKTFTSEKNFQKNCWILHLRRYVLMIMIHGELLILKLKHYCCTLTILDLAF